MQLTPIAEKFVLHWGEMGSRWGVNRTVGQIHALLYLAEQPIHAEEICETLSIARSNVSTSLKELMDWGLVRVVHVMGERRDHFEALHDIWEVFRVVAQGRRRREIDPTLTLMRSTLMDPAFSKESATTRTRIQQVHDFLDVSSTWVDEMQRLDPATLMKIMKLGSRIQRLLGGGSASAAEKAVSTKR
jgi:DNA-binding transcriptional regulator GbsR (MarR family)